MFAKRARESFLPRTSAGTSGTNFVSRLDSIGWDFMGQVTFVLLVVICMVILISIGSAILNRFLQPDNPYIIYGRQEGTRNIVFPNEGGKDGVLIQRSDNATSGIEFSWSVWLYITSLAGAVDYLHVFSKGDNNTLQPVDGRGIATPNNAPGLYIKRKNVGTTGELTNELHVVMNTFENIEETVDIDNIPLQKWFHTLIRVEGQFLDVYINGVLARRTELTSVPKQNNGSVYVAQNGGFNGYISNLRYFNRALSPGSIVAVVNDGPNLKSSKNEMKSLDGTMSNYLALDWYFNSAAQDGTV